MNKFQGHKFEQLRLILIHSRGIYVFMVGYFQMTQTIFILEKRLLTAREVNWNECLSNDQLNWSFKCNLINFGQKKFPPILFIKGLDNKNICVLINLILWMKEKRLSDGCSPSWI